MTAPTTAPPAPLPASPRLLALESLHRRARVLAALVAVVGAQVHDLGTALDADPHPALRV